MAAARIQFALERTLPDITSTAFTSLFSPDELRAVTHQRSRFESALHRRGLDEDDVLAYARFEVSLDQLRTLRQRRAERDGTLPALEPEQRAQCRRAYLSRVVSIYERGVKRRPALLRLWTEYMRWARSQGMNVVLGRITSRALALHNTVPALWVSAASNEVERGGEMNKARALLQRGLELCKLPFSAPPHDDDDRDEAERASPENSSTDIDDDAPRPSKRTKTPNGARGNASGARRRSRAPPPSAHEPSLIVGDAEAQLVSLWIEYLRFELVFLERLRRRWEVLGISAIGTTKNTSDGAKEMEQHALAETGGASSNGFTDAPAPSGNDDDELVVAEAVPSASDGQPPTSKSTPAVVTAQAPGQALAPILSGAIPTSIFRSSLSLLPARLHLVFLVASLRVVRAFPFLPSSLNPPPRAELLDVVHALLRERFAASGATALLDSARKLLDDDHGGGGGGVGAGVVEDVEAELEHGELLRELGRLGVPNVVSELVERARSIASTAMTSTESDAFHHELGGEGKPQVEARAVRASEAVVWEQVSSALSRVWERACRKARGHDDGDDGAEADAPTPNLPRVLGELVERLREYVDGASQGADTPSTAAAAAAAARLHVLEMRTLRRLRALLADFRHDLSEEGGAVGASSSSSSAAADVVGAEDGGLSSVLDVLNEYVVGACRRCVQSARRAELLDAELEADWLALELDRLARDGSDGEVGSDQARSHTQKRTSLLRVAGEAQEALDKLDALDGRRRAKPRGADDAEGKTTQELGHHVARLVAIRIRALSLVRREPVGGDGDGDGDVALSESSLHDEWLETLGGRFRDVDVPEAWSSYLSWLREYGADTTSEKPMRRRLESALLATLPHPSSRELVVREYLRPSLEGLSSALAAHAKVHEEDQQQQQQHSEGRNGVAGAANDATRQAVDDAVERVRRRVATAMGKGATSAATLRWLLEHEAMRVCVAGARDAYGATRKAAAAAERGMGQGVQDDGVGSDEDAEEGDDEEQDEDEEGGEDDEVHVATSRVGSHLDLAELLLQKLHDSARASYLGTRASSYPSHVAGLAPPARTGTADGLVDATLRWAHFRLTARRDAASAVEVVRRGAEAVRRAPRCDEAAATRIETAWQSWLARRGRR